MLKNIQRFLCIFLFLVTACSSSSSNTPYKIGIDPSFYSIETVGREKNILGFITDLTSEIAEREKIKIVLQPVNWDTMFSGLQSKSYQGVFSGMPPYNFTEKNYSFSSVFLKTGPVLVVGAKSSYKSLADLSNKEVGILTGSKNVVFLEKNPNIIIRPYDSTPKMLNQVALGVIEAAVVGILPAEAFCNDLYQGILKIVGGPLAEEGLRLITLNGEQKPLMHAFDKAIRDMQSDGSYAKLMQKWGLSS